MIPWAVEFRSLCSRWLGVGEIASPCEVGDDIKRTEDTYIYIYIHIYIYSNEDTLYIIYYVPMRPFGTHRTPTGAPRSSRLLSPTPTSSRACS